ncbi:hypothetical protein LP419_10895 [Massilia sp. H-1]|nr:hypothetical protein LP419_10895 [Massilia sp. H-1]
MKFFSLARRLLVVSLCLAMLTATAAHASESKIKLRLGIHLLDDGPVKSAALDAADDITRTLSLLTHPTKTPEEITKALAWTEKQPLLLALTEPPVVNNPLYRANGRQIRLCYALGETSDWHAEGEQLSFRVRYVGTTARFEPVVEVQHYRKQGRHWHLFKQVRMPQ